MPNMASLKLVMSRRSIDLKCVHILGQREIRWHIIIITWRLARKTEIAVVAVLLHGLVRGGTKIATLPILTENTWET